MSIALPSYYIWMVFILPYVGSLIILILSKAQRIRDLVAVAFPFLSAIFSFMLLLPILYGESIEIYDSVIPRSVTWISSLGVNAGLLYDPYTIILSNIVAWVSFLIMVYSIDYMKGDPGILRYWFFMNLFIGSMQLIVLSDNLLMLFIGWEMVGLCSYALIGYFYRDEIENWVGTPGERVLGEEHAYSPSHAGLKALVMTRVGDIAMLAGILILFIYSGTFSYRQLASSTSWATGLGQVGLLLPVALLIFGGAIGKSAQFPLHEWLPDAMAGPAPVSALIHAATMVKAGVVLVARIAPLFYFAISSNPSLIQPFFITIAWIGAFTAFLAATQAMVGFEMKKILAYSTISQIGYMMLAMGLAGLTNFAQGLSAGLYHLMSHAIFKASMFLVAGVLIHTTGSKYINDMGGIKDRMKITFASFLMATASLSGIPPFSGFWSKDAIISEALDSGQFGLFTLSIITAGLTAFYSFRMLGLAFFGKLSPGLEKKSMEEHGVRDPSPIMWVPFILLSIGTLLIGLISTIGYLIPSFNIELVLTKASYDYLSTLFPQVSPESVSPFNPQAASITGLFVIFGLLPAVTIYLAMRYRPTELIGEKGIMHNIYTFIRNRWYINAIYYKAFVRVPVNFSLYLSTKIELSILNKVNDLGPAIGLALSSIGNWIDFNIIDAIANHTALTSQTLSRIVRRIQTGITEQYIFVFTLGIIVLLLAFVLFLGVRII